MRTRAGLCVPNQNRIELNPNILTDPKDFESTLVHELCHLVIYRSWPRAEAHGAKWKSLMKLCGFEAERCHRIESPLKRVQKTWSLYCQCESPHQVKTRTYNKISKRRHRYICKSCHQTLTQEPKKT